MGTACHRLVEEALASRQSTTAAARGWTALQQITPTAPICCEKMNVNENFQPNVALYCDGCTGGAGRVLCTCLLSPLLGLVYRCLSFLNLRRTELPRYLQCGRRTYIMHPNSLLPSAAADSLTWACAWAVKVAATSTHQRDRLISPTPQR